MEHEPPSPWEEPEVVPIPGSHEYPINLRCETCRGAIHTREPESAFDWLERHLHLA